MTKDEIEPLREKLVEMVSLWSLNGSEWPSELVDEILALPEIAEALADAETAYENGYSAGYAAGQAE